MLCRELKWLQTEVDLWTEPLESNGELYARRSRTMKEKASIRGICRHRETDVPKVRCVEHRNECRSLMLPSIVSERDNVIVLAFGFRSHCQLFVRSHRTSHLPPKQLTGWTQRFSYWPLRNGDSSSLIAGLANNTRAWRRDDYNANGEIVHASGDEWRLRINRYISPRREIMSYNLCCEL